MGLLLEAVLCEVVVVSGDRDVVADAVTIASITGDHRK